MLARGLAKLDLESESLEFYREVLRMHSRAVDESEIPWALYACTPLLEKGQNLPEVVERIEIAISSTRWLFLGISMNKGYLSTIRR